MPCSADELADFLAGGERVLVDLGCGDGRFAWREARADLGARVIGVDPVAAAMAATAVRAARKPARGGAANLLLVVAAVEALPGELAGRADRITVNLPWGSLLAGLVLPAPAVLAAVAALGRPGARLSILLNASVFEDPDYRDRLRLPAVDLHWVETVLVPAFGWAGLRLTSWVELAASAPRRTSWGERLVRGGGRRLLALDAEVMAAPA